MYTDDHAGRKRGQNVEEEHRRVRVHEDAMGAVEEHDVSRSSFSEDAEVRGFERSPDGPVAEPVDLRARMRVDRDQPGAETAVAFGSRGEFRGVPGTDLDVQAGTPSAKKGVDRRRVEAGKHRV